MTPEWSSLLELTRMHCQHESEPDSLYYCNTVCGNADEQASL